MGNTVLVIGGGAAGLSACVAIIRAGGKAILLERMDRIGKKILATGNGRCNVMNVGVLRYPGGQDFASQVLAELPPQALEAFFLSLGIPLRKEDEGRVYPASGHAASVLDAFALAVQENVTIITGAEVTRLEKTKSGFIAHTKGQVFHGNKVIICGGGKAAPKLGSNGSCYKLLTALGHPCTPLRPALTQLETDTAPIRGLSGIRFKGSAYLSIKDKVIARQQGEFLFTDYGVSGVAAMQLARDAQEKGTILHLDLSPALSLSKKQVAPWLLKRHDMLPLRALEQFFVGAFQPRLGVAILRQAGIAPLSRQVNTLTQHELGRLHNVITNFELAVTGVKGFDSAQITWGGIDPYGFNPATMESLLAKGVYAAGEILDVDGDCGGFNLMFAFASGILAGQAAGK